ncbi:hypothetical protein ACLOJK_010976 [Asimina triloba]
MLSQILSSEARERQYEWKGMEMVHNSVIYAAYLNIETGVVDRFLAILITAVARIALVKPEKARGVEDVVLRAAQMGQIAEKVSEERLISLLEQINTQTSKQTKVTIQRRRSVLEDDD